MKNTSSIYDFPVKAGNDSNNLEVSDEYQRIIAELIAAREEKGISQAELGRRIERHRGTINNWEALRRVASYDDLRFWAEALEREVRTSIVRRGSGAHDHINARLASLPRQKVELVRRLVDLIEDMDPRDEAGVAAYIAALEAMQRDVEVTAKSG